MSKNILELILQSVVFSFLGVLVFGLAFFVICKILPFSVRKEIEVDQNTSLGIVLGSVILGLSIIVASAIH